MAGAQESRMKKHGTTESINQQNRPRSPLRMIRLVGLFEAFKGFMVLLAGTGLLANVHRNLPDLAAIVIAHLHLNPASHYPRIFLDAARSLQDQHLVLLALGAALYATVRLAEGYGLYFDKAWAEILAAASGAIYVPFEIYALLHRPSWHAALFLALNLAIVALMLFALRRRRLAAKRQAS